MSPMNSYSEPGIMNSFCIRTDLNDHQGSPNSGGSLETNGVPAHWWCARTKAIQVSEMKVQKKNLEIPSRGLRKFLKGLPTFRSGQIPVPKSQPSTGGGTVATYFVPLTGS